jgi:hypothetical protein
MSNCFEKFWDYVGHQPSVVQFLRPRGRRRYIFLVPKLLLGNLLGGQSSCFAISVYMRCLSRSLG